MFERTSEENLRTKALAGAEALYRLTDLPSFDHALKLTLRKHATEFLGGITGMALFTHVRRSTERERLMAMALSIQELLRFSNSLGLVTAENAERVSGAYRAAGEYLSSIRVDEEPRPAPTAGTTPFTPNERQGRILSFLASNGRAQFGDIRQIFGDTCSEKTLQRDLWQLVNAGRIKRHGDKRWTVYSIGHLDVR